MSVKVFKKLLSLKYELFHTKNRQIGWLFATLSLLVSMFSILQCKKGLYCHQDNHIFVYTLISLMHRYRLDLHCILH